MVVRLAIVIVLLALGTPAFAQHDHAHDDHHARPAEASAFAVGVSLVAASYDTMLYVGSYEGIVPSVRWSNARFAAIASTAAYHLDKNGGTVYGMGDASVHGQVLLVSDHSFDAGVVAGFSLPTGDDRRGLGMGHVMIMPGVFAAWTVERLRMAASVGYSRALGASDRHDHGAWPLVSPMLVSEVSWNAGGDLRVTPRITAGARASGGVPASDGSDARAIVAGRVGVRHGRMDSAVEVQAGIVGDPFTVRGVLSTMVSF